MSLIGKKPVALASGVTVKVAGRDITVTGKQGTLNFSHRPEVSVVVDEEAKEVRVDRADDSRTAKAMHGLTRSLIANMVEGVNEGFSKTLEINGVGYRAQAQGKTLNLALGYSHPVNFEAPEGVTLETPTQTEILVKGIDKQKVGQTAAVVPRPSARAMAVCGDGRPRDPAPRLVHYEDRGTQRSREPQRADVPLLLGREVDAADARGRSVVVGGRDRERTTRVGRDGSPGSNGKRHSPSGADTVPAVGASSPASSRSYSSSVKRARDAASSSSTRSSSVTSHVSGGRLSSLESARNASTLLRCSCGARAASLAYCSTRCP